MNKYEECYFFMMDPPGTIEAGKAPTMIARVKGFGRILAAIFSLIVIFVIAFFVLDEANARFGTIALSALIVILTKPSGESLRLAKFPWLGWLIDCVLIGAFLFSAYWFFAVKEELWTGFYIANPMNIAAGLAGMITIVLLTIRAWGWSLAIMAMFFVGFGFAGPWLPGILEHFGVDIRDFMQIVWYSFDGVFGRVTGLVARQCTDIFDLWSHS